jgi:HEAT repeat protein
MLPSDAWQALVTVELLGDIGPAAKPALPYLKEIFNTHEDAFLRRSAAIAIRKIDPQEAAQLHLPGILALP